MSIKTFAIAAIATLGFAGPVLAKDAITWGLVNFDPNNTSRTDKARELIQEKLPAYEHTTVVAPIPRIVSEIKAGSHWCWAGAIKTDEREAFSFLSVPFIFTFPQRIMVRRERQAEFAAKAPLSLEGLLQDRSLRTSVNQSRAYSPAIDELFKRYPTSQSASGIPEAIKMLLADRLDYVIEDAGVANAHAQQQGRQGGLVALNFKEMSGYVMGRVMCPKTDWGKKVINDINGVIRSERGSPRYRAIVEAFHGEDDARTLRQAYDAVFLKAD
jgi:uncharacterized protein (TIGR02285 family)